MGIWHKSLEDAQRAYDAGDFRKALEIIKAHSESIYEESESIRLLIRGFDEYKKRVWKLANLNLTGNIDQDREWLELLNFTEASLNQAVKLLAELHSKLKKE